MKDYASMSDEKIAAMVAGLCTIEGVSINEYGVAVRSVVDDSPGSYSGGDYIEFDFDPCNNPADAWPIITQYRISIIDLNDNEWGCRVESAHGVMRAINENPLRCAMIVFLMMKEGE